MPDYNPNDRLPKFDSSQIRPDITMVQNMIKSCQLLIKTIQEHCEHKFVIVKYGSCGSFEDREYWQDMRCIYCDKFKTGSQ